MSLSIHISKEQIEAELKKQQPMLPGYHEFDLTEVYAKEAKDKVSMNYVVKHVHASGVSIEHYFNSKPFGQTFIIKFFAALNNFTIQEFMEKLGSEVDLNFENVKGKKVMAKVIHGIGENGKIFNNLEDWAPVGKVPF